MSQKVAIVMGSKSDIEVAKKAVDVFKKLEITYELRVISAHRTPEIAFNFAKTAQENGFFVIIAVAGMAAHLAGVLASHTLLPVIGVPCKGGAADGLDALLATVQMPSGVPVATVALGGGANAAVLAAQILALSNPMLAKKLAQQREKMQKTVIEDDLELQKKFL